MLLYRVVYRNFSKYLGDVISNKSTTNFQRSQRRNEEFVYFNTRINARDFDYYETHDLKSNMIGYLDLSVCHKFRKQLINVCRSTGHTVVIAVHSEIKLPRTFGVQIHDCFYSDNFQYLVTFLFSQVTIISVP